MRSILSGLAAVLAAACCAKTQAAEPNWIDPFNVGIDIRKVCDFHDHTPMSEPCRTLIGAVVEIEKGYVGLDDETRKRLNRACIPPNLSLLQVYDAIRPELRKTVGFCAGLCTSTGYVRTSLIAVFPCPAGKQ